MKIDLFSRQINEIGFRYCGSASRGEYITASSPARFALFRNLPMNPKLLLRQMGCMLLSHTNTVLPQFMVVQTACRSGYILLTAQRAFISQTSQQPITRQGDTLVEKVTPQKSPGQGL